MATWSEYVALGHRTTIADKDVIEAVKRAAGSEMPPLTAHRVVKTGSVHGTDEESRTMVT